jgi:outer membrane protein assembly factor BamD (BamD/ComL family)
MARAEFDAGRVDEALSLLERFTALHPAGSDEAWWLFGQSLEADSPNRDILSALNYYRRLVGEFPQSSRLSAARGRIAFIERFFLNIR